MDTNTMYIEHYVDLHNYISDNIYELNDDVIFTESIWKKVLIGGLAIGGIALIWKYHRQIMEFIQKHLPNKVEKTFTILEQAKKPKEEVEEEKPKEEKPDEKPKEKKKENNIKDDTEEVIDVKPIENKEAKQEVKETPKVDTKPIENKENNKSDKKKNITDIFKKIFQTNKVEKLYIFDDIYNNKDKYLNQFTIYYREDNDPKLTNEILNDKNQLKQNTKQLSIYKMYEKLEKEKNINKDYDRSDIFEKLSLITKQIKEKINEKKFIDNHNEFVIIINNIEKLLLIAYAYIYSVLDDSDIDENYFDNFRIYDITKQILLMYTLANKGRSYNYILDDYKDQKTGNFNFNKQTFKNLLKDIEKLKLKDSKYFIRNNNEYIKKNKRNFGSTYEPINKEKPPKFAYINIHTFLNYRRWFLYQLISIFDAIQSWIK
jgi:hypothetical protein